MIVFVLWIFTIWKPYDDWSIILFDLFCCENERHKESQYMSEAQHANDVNVTLKFNWFIHTQKRC